MEVETVVTKPKIEEVGEVEAASESGEEEEEEEEESEEEGQAAPGTDYYLNNRLKRSFVIDCIQLY